MQRVRISIASDNFNIAAYHSRSLPHVKFQHLLQELGEVGEEGVIAPGGGVERSKGWGLSGRAMGVGNKQQ
jgi:hypothetical protein